MCLKISTINCLPFLMSNFVLEMLNCGRRSFGDTRLKSVQTQLLIFDLRFEISTSVYLKEKTSGGDENNNVHDKPVIFVVDVGAISCFHVVHPAVTVTAHSYQLLPESAGNTDCRHGPQAGSFKPNLNKYKITKIITQQTSKSSGLLQSY